MWRSPKQQKKLAAQAVASPQAQMVRRQVLVGIALFLFIAVLGSAVWYVTRLPGLQIHEVHVTGGFTISHDTVVAIAHETLEGEYFHLIPKRFGLLYPHDTIAERIQTIDRVKSVGIERDDDNNLQIAFEEHRPFALWCMESGTAECYFLEPSGLAFAPAPELVGGAFLRYVTEEEPQIDAYVADQAFLTKTTEFVRLLRDELGLVVTRVIKRGTYDVDYELAWGGHIKVSQDMEARSSFDNLKTILSSEEFAHLTESEFDYIDLRFGDKVFVHEFADVVASSTATSSTESGE